MLGPCFTEFKLDLPGTKNLSVGHVISKEIASGEYTLRVDCYPRGLGVSRSEYICIVMWLLQARTPKFSDPIFEVFVVGKDGDPSSSHSQRSKGVILKLTNAQRCKYRNCPAFPVESLGRRATHGAMWSPFVKRSDLEPLQAADGVVRLVFGIVVKRDDGAIGAVPASDIGDHLGRLLDHADGSDVSFLVGSETFHAHRAVLAARSPVFKAELLGSMAEARMARITVHDMEPAVFKALLWFAYTDKLPQGAELAGPSIHLLIHLLVAADRYALDRLKLVCANKLWQNVTVDTAASVLACAEAYNCPALKDSCMDFFLEEKNFKKATLTEGFGQLELEFPSIIAELRERAGI